MSLDRLLEEATSPADAAEAAQLMAAATANDSEATEQQRKDARYILALSWEELLARFTPASRSVEDEPSAVDLQDPAYVARGATLKRWRFKGASGAHARTLKVLLSDADSIDEADIRQIESSLPDGAELVVIDEVPLRSNGSDRP